MTKKSSARPVVEMESECVRLILRGIEDMKTQAQIARELHKQFNLTVSGMKKRIAVVWDALSKESKEDALFDRAKVSQALLALYREAKEDSDIERILQALDEFEVPADQRWRILAKWDPHKSKNIALKALDQYNKLNGLNAPEQVETTHKHQVDPQEFTPEEKRKRIAELLSKRELEGPVASDNPGPGRPAGLKN